MKIGIVGPAERAVAWEEHLRPHRTVEEVIIAANLEDIGNVDACLLFDESEEQLQTLLQSVQLGYHTFLISPLPTDHKAVEKVYHASEEANVLLQFSHWPTLAPASQWMAKKIAKPTFIQVNREISHTRFLEMKYDIEYFWIDELAFCLKWIDGTVHNIDLKTVELQNNKIHALHLFLRFDSGATANIFVNTCSLEENHHRFAADHAYLVDCDVEKQSVRIGQENEATHLFFNKQHFDSSKAAEMAATQFIKAIQLKKPTLYTGYDLLTLTKEIERIRKRLGTFRQV